MRKALTALAMIVFVMGIASASVTPDRIEFYYPMAYDNLRLSLEQEGMDYEREDRTIILDYGDFYVSVDENHMEINCKEVDNVCMDGRTLETVLEDLERMETFDISKEDKETIGDLYKANTLIRQIEKKNLMFARVKASVLKFLGRLFCTNYENILESKNDWCSIEMMRSKECTEFDDDY